MPLLGAFGAALSLLTRFSLPLAPPVEGTAAAERTVLCYAPVGLVVGLVCTLPLWAVHVFGAVRLWPLAWGYVLLGMWTTRGLHWDGLSDIGDAWGSGARGERFWQILKDSRLGAFGALMLLAGFSGMLIAAQGRLEHEQWGALVLAPVFGRVCAVLLAAWAPPRNRGSLGGGTCTGATWRAAAFNALLALVCTLSLTPGDAAATLACGGILLWCLRALARREGGSNGDFLGAAIVGGELVFLMQL